MKVIELDKDKEESNRRATERQCKTEAGVARLMVRKELAAGLSKEWAIRLPIS